MNDEQDVDRTRNQAAEREVIGTVLRAPVYADVAMKLRADDFTTALHQTTWRVIAKLLDSGDPIKVQTVAAACGNTIDGQGRRDLEIMASVAAGSIGILHEAISSVMDASRRRAAVATYNAAARRSRTSEDPVEATIARASVEIDEAVSGREKVFTGGKEVVRRLRHDLENPKPRVKTGIAKLDHVLEGGMVHGRMMSIIAKTKIGKTTLAGTISTNVLTAQVPHLVITLERKDTDIELICAARALGVNAVRLEQNFAKYADAFKDYEDQPMHALRRYMHKPGATLEDILHEIMRAHRAGCTGFILDYYQLVARTGKESVVDHLSRVAQALADITSRLGMWSIVNAQSDEQGLPRECKALWLASPSTYLLVRDPDKPEAWLQCMGSSHTEGLDAGGAGSPAMMLDTTAGPHFRSV